MKRAHVQAATLALAVMFALLVGYVGAQQAPKAKPVTAAVADVKKIFDELQEKIQVEADIQTSRQALADESNRKKAEIEQLQADLKGVLLPGTPAFREKEEELQRKSIEYQVWVNFHNAKLAADSVVQTESLYRKMIASIDQVAKANSYDMVLFKEREIDFRGAKPEQLAAVIQVRKVLYANDDLDITDLVIQKMNNDYKNRPAGGEK